MITKEDIIYIAGLFDGEGCIFIQKHPPDVKRRMVNPHYQLTVTLSNTDIPVLEWIKTTFGGNFYLRKILFRKKEQGEWKLSDKKALSFLYLIRPYAKIKKEQVDIAITFQENRRPAGGNRILSEFLLGLYEFCYLELRRMKHGIFQSVEESET